MQDESTRTPRQPAARDEADEASTLSSQERAELQRQGAKAAARGEAAGDNPLNQSVNRPDRTGEPEDVWSERHEAWQRGHESQTGVRRDAEPPSQEVGDEGE